MPQQTAAWIEQAAHTKYLDLTVPDKTLLNQRRRSRSASSSLQPPMASRDWKSSEQDHLESQQPYLLDGYTSSTQWRAPQTDIVTPPSWARGQSNAISMHMQPPSNSSGTICWDHPQPFARGTALKSKHAEETIDPLVINACARSLALPPSTRPELTYGFLASLDLSTTALSSACPTRTSYSSSSASGSAMSARTSATSLDLEGDSSYFGAFEEWSTLYDENTRGDSTDTIRIARDCSVSAGKLASASEHLHDCQPDLDRPLASSIKQQPSVETKFMAKRCNRTTSLPSVQPSAALLDPSSCKSPSEVLSYHSQVLQQRNALRDLSDELEIYLEALAERRAGCSATVQSRAFTTISILLSASRARDCETDAERSYDTGPAWASTFMEREPTPENQTLSILAAYRRMSLQNTRTIAPLSLMRPRHSMQIGKANVTQQRRRSCISGRATYNNCEAACQLEESIFPQGRRSEERLDFHFLHGVARLATSLFATDRLDTGCRPSLAVEPANSFDGEVLSSIAHVLERHRGDWDLILAAERRLSMVPGADGTLLPAVFAHVASSLLP